MRTIKTKQVRDYLDMKLEALGIDESVILKNHPLELGVDKLPGVTEASDVLIEIITRSTGVIVLNCDYDLDGMLSGTINYLALLTMGVPDERIVIFQNHRKYGNGVNEWAIDKFEFLLKKYKVDAYISSDHGSNNDENWGRLKKMSPDTFFVCTDHHLFDKTPKNPDIFINPQREDSPVEFKNLSGGATTWFLMLSIFEKLEGAGFKFDKLQKDFLTILAGITTIGDSMDMLDIQNRAIVSKALWLMNNLDDIRLDYLKRFIKLDTFTSSTISFKIGPIINAAGRMDNPLLPLDFFLLPFKKKKQYKALSSLINLNDKRKKLQAFVYSSLCNSDTGVKPFVVCKEYNKEDISGITGPIASSFVQDLERPAVILTEVDGSLKGSCRSIEGIHIRNVLARLDDEYPGLLETYGGHSGAAGVSVKLDKYEEFVNALNDVLSKTEIEENGFGTDDIIVIPDDESFGKELLTDIQNMAPFGNRWKEPDVSFTGKVVNKFVIAGLHVAYTIELSNGQTIGCFDFNGHYREINRDKKVRITGSLGLKREKGHEVLSLFVNSIKALKK